MGTDNFQREDLDEVMERNLRLGRPEAETKVELDIRKILEQMGLDKDRWPAEWREKKEERLSS